MRNATLLVSVRAVSGETYPPGTAVTISGSGSVADAFVGGDWISLSWWEFSEDSPPADEHRDM